MKPVPSALKSNLSLSEPMSYNTHNDKMGQYLFKVLPNIGSE